MDAAFYEKVVIADSEFPIVILGNDKTSGLYRQSLCPLHWHEHLELHYIMEGTLHFCIHQKEYTFEPGDLAVVNRNDIHNSWFSGRLKERILIFQPEALSKKLAPCNIPFQRHIPKDYTISRIMESFEREYTHMEASWEASCLGLLLQLIPYLARHYPLLAATDPENTRHSQQLNRLLPVQNYIALHYSEDISVQTLADLVYVSRDRFNHLFKACMGIPLRRYINDIRLHTAYRWLEQGLYPPAEAASRVGFTDYNHFGRLFRQTFGCTPSQVKPQNSKIV